ncbi:MAG: hypothetical protein JXR37_11490 [Kiritimatiellae bacterium]|nr:hypothetical protein [Kiritimatiellia bacterium]
MNRTARLILTGMLAVPALADGPHIPPGQEAAIVKEHLAAPEHYDIFHGKKDRLYLTGVWKLRWEWNFLTKAWIEQNMKSGKIGRAQGIALNDGVTPPYQEIAPRAEHLALEADVADWWDVLVPHKWNETMPYEENNTRTICDYPLYRKNNYAFGGVGFYRRTFAVPAEKAGKRAILHFDCVETQCAVWVNGRQMGEHRNFREQGSGRVTGVFLDGFDLEITDAIKPGQPNVVTVRVYDTGLPFVWHYADPGGITGLVWIEFLPRQFFAETLITAPFGVGRIQVECLPAPAAGRPFPDEVRVRIAPWQSADYTFPGADKRTYEGTARLSPPDEEGRRRFELATPGIQAWDVVEPNLYELRILDTAGATMAIERFGVRTFAVKGDRFVLNGKPVYLFGHCSGYFCMAERVSAGKDALNWNNEARHWLRMQRAANFTSQRIHTGPVHRNAYYFCDEVGLMVRDEWTPSALKAIPKEEESVIYLGDHDVSASFTADQTAFVPAVRAKLKQWVRSHYNSPSVITWSGGNEMSAGDAKVRLYVTLLYEFLHKHDGQQRPVTSNSGLFWFRGDPELLRTPLPVDYLDYHSYQEIFHRWIGAARDYRESYDKLMAIYGGKPYPVVNGEWLAHGGKTRGLCKITPDIFDARGEPSLDGYLQLLADLKARRKPYNYPRTAWEYLGRIAAGGIRIAASYQADADARARYHHQLLEVFRRDCPRQVGYSAFAMEPDMWEKVDPERKRVRYEYGSPEFEAFRMAQQPLIAIPDFWARHVLAEDGLEFKAHVINWSREAYRDGRLAVRIARNGGAPIAEQTVGLDPLAIGDRRVVPLSLAIAGSAQPGAYEVTLDLLANGRVASRNVHPVLVRRRAEFPALRTAKRAALYEVPDGPDTVAGLAAAAGLPLKRLDALRDLAGLDVLLLGRDSLDAEVSRAARGLRAFVERGGTLLVFEQKTAAQLPWAPVLRYERCGNVPNADPIVTRHPVFRGLAPPDFEDWGAEHTVYNTLIHPTGKNLLAGGANSHTGFWEFCPESEFGMTVAEFRLGKGRCLLSQLKVTECYRQDSAALAFGYNLLDDALTDASRAAAVPPLAGDDGRVSDQPILSREDLNFVWLGKQANREIADPDSQGWMGLREGLDDLPRGYRLFGGVFFRILKPDKKLRHTALVLGRTPKQPQTFPAAITGIWVGQPLKKLFFLHTAAWVSAEEDDELCRYVVHYQDKSKAEFPIRNRKEIADWYLPKDLENARVPWRSAKGKGVYLTAWDNPHPAKKIDAIDVKGSDKGFVGIVGISGLKGE